MAARPDLYPFEADLHFFDTVLAEAQASIVAQIEAAVRSGDLGKAGQRRAQLASIDRTLAQLAATANPLASRMVSDAWHQGANRALEQMQALPIQAADIGTFSGVSREAVEVFQRSLLGRLDEARSKVGRQVNDVYAREQRRAAQRAILGADGSPQSAGREMRARLLKDRDIKRAIAEGKTGFQDRAGRQWSLKAYSNMATRTITREAVVQGAVTRMASHGIAIGRISTHPNACEICQPFEGTLVDLGGSGITEYRGEAVSDNGELPPFHPNCAHSIRPISATIDSVREEMGLAVA